MSVSVLPWQLLPLNDRKEDRGHVGGLFKCCSDHAFYFLRGKEKKAIGRKNKNKDRK